MKLTNEFVVPAPVERAWTVLLDVERIAPCVPGASIDEAGEGRYAGTMKVKLGPMVTTFKGTLELQEADEAARRSVLKAQARDARGQGSASATITSRLEPEGDGTKVVVETDMRVTGPLAQFGRGVMQDVSAKLMGQFADCLAGELSAEPAASASPAPAQARPTVANEAGPADVAGGRPGNGGPPSEAGVAQPTEPPRAARPTPEVLDVMDAGRDAVVRRAAPAAGVLLLVVLVLRALRRR